MPMALLDALIARDRAAVGRLVDFKVPSSFPSAAALRLIRLRRAQVASDSAWSAWSLRAMVLRATSEMVGFVNFHGPPGINEIGAPDAVELGWTVFPKHRRNGYASETALALMDWATRVHGIRRFVSSTRARNTASLRVHDKLGFARTGQVVDGEIIFELLRSSAVNR